MKLKDLERNSDLFHWTLIVILYECCIVHTKISWHLFRVESDKSIAIVSNCFYRSCVHVLFWVVHVQSTWRPAEVFFLMWISYTKMYLIGLVWPIFGIYSKHKTAVLCCYSAYELEYADLYCFHQAQIANQFRWFSKMNWEGILFVCFTSISSFSFTQKKICITPHTTEAIRKNSWKFQQLTQVANWHIITNDIL